MHDQAYLDHAADEIQKLLGNIKTIVFVPYALADRDTYAAVARERFAKMDITLTSVHEEKSAQNVVAHAEAMFIGGGNTFRLLDALYKNKLIEVIRKKVSAGMPYIGSSAGSNVAGQTIKTTNDMPIIYPPSFDALQLVAFNINPHFIDADPNSKHMGETREQRIKEFHEENDTPVMGLREGAMLQVDNEKVYLKGTTGAKVFMKSEEPREYTSGELLHLS